MLSILILLISNLWKICIYNHKPKALIVQLFNSRAVALKVQGLWDIASSDQVSKTHEEESSENTSKLTIIKDELGVLGLTINEIEIYTLLARSGSKKASDISKILSMPKTETYETLSNLQNKEIVCEVSGRPVMFEAKSLKATFKILIQKKKSDITNSEHSMHSVVNLWQSLPPIAIGITSSQQFQKLTGLHRVYHKIREMTLNASNELIIMASTADLTKLVTYGIMDDIATTIDNGVDVTIITESDCDIISEDEELNIVKSSSVEGNLPHLLLMDREEMLAITEQDLDEKETKALWTSSSSLCEAIHLFFAYDYSH
jgi:sugar-specific transcriptional regulator TrmB